MEKSIVEWTVDLDNSITAIGLIVEDENPAIEVNAVFKEEKFNVNKLNPQTQDDKLFLHLFSQHQKEEYQGEPNAETVEELRRDMSVVGPALIPNKLIFRVDDNGEHFGYFPAETVKKVSQSFQKNKLSDRFNINHNQEDYVDGVYVTETWLIEDEEQDKSKLYGYDLPEGSWMIKLKFDNQELYDQYVAAGQFNGFSIETRLLERVIY